jgi:hypothetical protein
MDVSQVSRRTLVVLALLAIGLSAALLALGAMIGLSEAHAGTPAMIRHARVQFVVASGSLLWSIVAALRWRDGPTNVAALALMGAGQLCLWELLRRYEIVRVWSPMPTVLASGAVASVAAAWWSIVRSR